MLRDRGRTRFRGLGAGSALGCKAVGALVAVGACCRSELQFLQWYSNGLTLGLSLATEMYTLSHSNGLAYGSTRGVSSNCVGVSLRA